MATETPDYQVESAHGAIEIRRYGPRIVAEITVEGSRRDAVSDGFTPLANYIFAKERGGGDSAAIAMTTPVMQSRPDAPIAMTAPVTQAARSDGRWAVQFIMPSKYTIDTLPKPGRADVRLETVPPQRVAAIRFSGHPTDDNVARHEDQLRQWMADQVIAGVGPPVYAYYDAPFKPGFLRRNEVMIPLAAPAPGGGQ